MGSLPEEATSYHQTLKRPAPMKDKPTKGANISHQAPLWHISYMAGGHAGEDVPPCLRHNPPLRLPPFSTVVVLRCKEIVHFSER